MLFSTLRLKADDLQVGNFFIKNGEIVKLQDNATLEIVYDNGKTGKISNKNGLTKISDYSSLSPIIKSNIDHVLKQVEDNILSFEESLKKQFDDTYLEMSTACLMADAEYASSKIAGIITEDRTFSLEGLSNTCKEYNYYEDLKVVFEQCKFYEDFLEFANNETSKKVREAERQIRWLEANSSLDNKAKQQKDINHQRNIIQQFEKDRIYLPAIKTIINNAKAQADTLDRQYYRVYNKTNDIFLLYSKLYDKQINGADIKGQLAIVNTLVDEWTKTFLQELTIKATIDAKLAQKELYRRRNPAPALKASINIASEKTAWGKDLDVYINVENTGNANANNIEIRLVASADPKYGNKDDYTINVWRNQYISTNDSWTQNSYRLKLPSTPYNSYLPHKGDVYFAILVEQVKGEMDTSDNVAAKKVIFKKEGCFVATVVYGSYDHPDVLVLRQFRDDILQHYAWGRCFISWYYENGPSWADSIRHHPFVADCIRFLLGAFVLFLLHPIWGMLITVGSFFIFSKKFKKVFQNNIVLSKKG